MTDVESVRHSRVGIYEDVATQGSYKDSMYRSTVYVYISHPQNHRTSPKPFSILSHLLSSFLCTILLSSSDFVSLVEPLSPLKPLSTRVIHLKWTFPSTRWFDSPFFADALSVALGAISRFPSTRHGVLKQHTQALSEISTSSPSTFHISLSYFFIVHFCTLND
jgi:hypothetical protein